MIKSLIFPGSADVSCRQCMTHEHSPPRQSHRRARAHPIALRHQSSPNPSCSARRRAEISASSPRSRCSRQHAPTSDERHSACRGARLRRRKTEPDRRVMHRDMPLAAIAPSAITSGNTAAAASSAGRPSCEPTAPPPPSPADDRAGERMRKPRSAGVAGCASAAARDGDDAAATSASSACVPSDRRRTYHAAAAFNPLR